MVYGGLWFFLKKFSFADLAYSQGEHMKPAQKKIEKIDQHLRIQPLRGGNLLYIT